MKKVEYIIKRGLFCLVIFSVILCFKLYSIRVYYVRGSLDSDGAEPNNAKHQKSAVATDIWNRHKIDYDSELRAEFEVLLKQQVGSTDTRLVGLVRKLLDPPVSHAMRKLSHVLFQTPQAKTVDDLLNSQEDLFFVEAGALDGERSSNTLWLETKRQWNGLLVEVDPYYYTQLRGKARTSHSINACISGQVDKLVFQECPGGCGKMKTADIKTRGVPCFSLETLMLALGRTTIDYFSLDIEGHEREVLDSIPWQKINIRAITVEYPGGLEGEERAAAIRELKAYMKKHGYTDFRQFDEVDVIRGLWNRDILFVKDTN